jgi:hypothetical protein
LAKLIAKCSQEEERLRAKNNDFVNLISKTSTEIMVMESMVGSHLSRRKERGRNIMRPQERRC